MHIFVMDYAHRRRVKIWGEASVVEDDPALATALMPVGYDARPEQVILSGSRRGTPTARSTSRSCSTRETWRRRWQ